MSGILRLTENRRLFDNLAQLSF